MADTFQEIYRNASLGATQLDDGEETILTTNSTTSYVIKDMYVNNTSTLGSTYLELNGFNVGSITKNATGSLVIPPNSTLKIKTTDYPYTFYKDTILAGDTNGLPVFEEQMYVAGSTNKTTTDSLVGTNNFSNYWSNTQRLYLNTANNGNRYWYIETHDNNSVQTLYYRQQSNGSGGQIEYANYSAMGFGYKNNGDFISYRSSSSIMYVQDQDQYPTSQPTNYYYRHNSISPYPTTSYPRHHFFQDHIWYRPSSGHNGNIYAYNVNTGVVKQYNTAGGASSGNNFFCVSHDARDDKLYIWEQSSGNFYVTELPHTLTYLLANQSNTTGGNAASTQNINQIPSHRTNTPINAAIRAAPHGGVQFSGTDNKLYSMDKDGNFMGDPYDKATFEVAGNTNFKDYLEITTSSVSTATAAANGIAAPTFGIQLLGVKSTT